MATNRGGARSRISFEDIQGGAHDKTGRAALLDLEKQHDKEFALCGQNLWYFARFIETYDEENELKRPFPLDYDHLLRLQQEMIDYNEVIVHKSRRGMLSWFGTLRQLWRAKFSGCGIEGIGEVFGGAVMTVGEKEAEELIKRISYMNGSLPKWLAARNHIIKDQTLQIEFEKGGVTMGFPLKREGPRTFGFSEVFFDEMAFQEVVRRVWQGMAPTLGAKGKVLAVSTSNGKFNLFHDMWDNKNNLYPDMRRIWVPHTDHPEHQEEWLAKLKKKMGDPQMISREIYGSFASYKGQAVWAGDFDMTTHVADKPIDVTEGVVVYLGWDFGYHFPALIIEQRNTKDQLIGIAELQGYDQSFDIFCKEALQLCASLYNRRKCREVFCVPPDGKQAYRTRSRSGAINDIQEIKLQFKCRPGQIKMGPSEVGSRQNEAPRMKNARKRFHLRADGQPGVYFSPTMEFFLDGCQGGYCYPDSNISEMPAENEYTHLQDAHQMVVSVVERIVNRDSKEPEKKKKQARPRIGGRYGL